MDIQSKIFNAKLHHIDKTGVEPLNCYLGRTEMRDLMKWAAANQYVANATTAHIEGDHRPEVSGMLIFEANAESHLACS